jgi:hypothetical protein
MTVDILGRLKARAYAFIFAREINNALLAEEREKFEQIQKIEIAQPLSILNYASKKDVGVDVYRSLHDGRGYSENNWAFDLIGQPEIVEGESFFEFGAGNGSFLELLCRRGKAIAGVDLINPRGLSEVITGDYRLAFESNAWRNSQVCYSADFLEHLELAELDNLFTIWAASKKKHLHLIACYDDSISHKTVMPPHLWALLFLGYFSNVEIREVYYRRYPGKKVATVIAFQT